MNTALEVWEGSEGSFSYPKTPAECYQTSLGILRDDAVKHPVYNPKKGVTSLLEMGMNPGLISHCVK